MPDVREKLVELQSIITCPNAICNFCEHFKNKSACEKRKKEVIADNMIANGVTIQRWIPVEERLPDHFGVFVVAISEPGKMRVGKDCADFDPFAKTWLPSMCWARGYKVTHWMPLPEPPKEE